MNISTHTPAPQPLTSADRQRLRDEALALAPQLRRAAVDDFWRSVHASLAATWGGAHHAAGRLAHRLSRRLNQPMRMG